MAARKPADKPSAPADQAAGADGAPSVHIPMTWVACGITLGAASQLFEDLRISWPQLSALNLMGESDKNTLVCARPKGWADALAAGNLYIKTVSGKLPDLVLYPAGTGDNGQVWRDYQAAHPPTGLVLDNTDWAPGRKLTHRPRKG